jgi:hypothetical protein
MPKPHGEKSKPSGQIMCNALTARALHSLFALAICFGRTNLTCRKTRHAHWALG